MSKFVRTGMETPRETEVSTSSLCKYMYEVITHKKENPHHLET